MQPRTRAAALLAAVAVAVACLATCRGDDDVAPKAEPQTAAIDAAPRRAPHPRRRAAPEPAVLPSAIGGSGSAALVGNSESVLLLPSATNAPSGWVETPPAPAEAPPTGRVRVQMLRDGRPFEGGHVCFVAAERFVEPGPWDGLACSDGAYFGLPMYTPMWPHFDPVLGSADGDQRSEESARGVTGADGTVTLDVRANQTLVPYVRYGSSGIPLVSQPRVSVAAGGETTLTIEAAPMRTLAGRCVDSADKPLAGIWVQAIAPGEERPLSRRVQTLATGEFRLEVFGTDREVRVRAVVPYVAHPLGIHDSEAEVPPIPAETTIVGVVPGVDTAVVRMHAAPLVFIELTVAEGDAPLGHVQIEGLAFDARTSSWGRLGGPKYHRANASPGGRRAVIALPRAEADRPLMLWSWGWTVTAVDPRGEDRVSVLIPRGRRASVRGRGWKDGDRLRVVSFLGPEGREFPCTWIDGVVGSVGKWSRDDSPVSAIEFQIVRDGAVVGRSARVPPGTGPAAEVAIDLE